LHELALAEEIVSSLLDLARKEGGRVVSFKVVVGELAQHDGMRIEDLLAGFIKGTELSQAKMVVETEEAMIRCLQCNSRWGSRDLIKPLPEDQKEMIHYLPELLNSFSKCPACGNGKFEIEKGKGIRIAEVKLDI